MIEAEKINLQNNQEGPLCVCVCVCVCVFQLAVEYREYKSSVKESTLWI